MRRPPHARVRGFTLVELLVALFALSLLAVMSWRGLDGMTRVQEQTQARADQIVALQVGLAQWSADLDALVELPQHSALDWNGRVLRMTRQGTGGETRGVVVVAWTRRVADGAPRWLRWQSPPVATRAELDQAWDRADVWSQNPGTAERAGEVAVAPLQDWQLFYYRRDAWTNPQSSDAEADGDDGAPGGGRFGAGRAATDARGTRTASIPDGVRLILTLPPGHPLAGDLTRDWARATVGGGKS